MWTEGFTTLGGKKFLVKVNFVSFVFFSQLPALNKKVYCDDTFFFNGMETSESQVEIIEIALIKSINSRASAWRHYILIKVWPPIQEHPLHLWGLEARGMTVGFGFVWRWPSPGSAEHFREARGLRMVADLSFPSAWDPKQANLIQQKSVEQQLWVVKWYYSRDYKRKMSRTGPLYLRTVLWEDIPIPFTWRRV